MNAADKLAPMITEPLTWAQICQRYPDQWVCVVEIMWDEPRSFHFRYARVVGSGKTRRDPLEQAKPWWDRYTSIGHYFKGKVKAPLPRFYPTDQVEVLLGSCGAIRWPPRPKAS